MDQPVEGSQPGRGAEDLRGQRPPGDLAAGVENFAPEFAHNLIISFSARRQHGMAQFVGLD